MNRRRAIAVLTGALGGLLAGVRAAFAGGRDEPEITGTEEWEEIPVLLDYDTQKPIGVLRIRPGSWPGPEYVGALGYQILAARELPDGGAEVTEWRAIQLGVFHEDRLELTGRRIPDHFREQFGVDRTLA